MKKILLALIIVPLLLSYADGKGTYGLHIVNGTWTGSVQGISYYSISSGEHFRILAVYHIGSYTNYGVAVNWYVDNVYQFTQGDTVEFSQPGLIYFKAGSFQSISIQLSVVTGINDLSTSTLPFPFSKLSSNSNINNLNYKIITPLGQIVEEGKFSGEIILRGNNISHSLQPGIYFVIYSDALDNRQVLTDKVFVSNQ